MIIRQLGRPDNSFPDLSKISRNENWEDFHAIIAILEQIMNKHQQLPLDYIFVVCVICYDTLILTNNK